MKILKRAATVLVAATLSVVMGASMAQAANVTYSGSKMVAPNTYCTVGPIAKSAGGIPYVLTAGHCIRTSGMSAHWVDNRTGGLIGQGVRWGVGALGPDGAQRMDVGAIRAPAGTRSQYRTSSGVHDITGFRDPRLDDKVCAILGQTGVVRCGTVTHANTTVTYGAPYNQTVQYVARVSGICMTKGDSGSPAMVGTVAVGIVVAASGCDVWITQLGRVMSLYHLQRA